MADSAESVHPIRIGEVVAFVGALAVAVAMPRLVPRPEHAFYPIADQSALFLLATASLALYGLGLLVVTRGDVRRVLPGALAASAICTVSMSLGVVCLRPSQQLGCIAALALVLTVPATKLRCQLSIIETLIATVPAIIVLTIAGAAYSGLSS